MSFNVPQKYQFNVFLVLPRYSCSRFDSFLITPVLPPHLFMRLLLRQHGTSRMSIKNNLLRKRKRHKLESFCNRLADHLHPLWHTRRTRGKTLAASKLVSPQPARTCGVMVTLPLVSWWLEDSECNSGLVHYLSCLGMLQLLDRIATCYTLTQYV